MTFVKQPHLVPEFYLNYFKDSTGNLYVFDKTLQKQFATSPKKVGKEGGFYDSEETGLSSEGQFVEKKLSNIESQVAPIYAGLVDKLYSNSFDGFSNHEKKIISNFVFYQMQRTKRSRTDVNELQEEILSQLRKKGVGPDSKIYKEFIEGFDSKKQHLFNLLDGFENIENELSNRVWIILKNNSYLNFYTSDHPANSFNHNTGINSIHEICIPLTPHYFLCILFERERTEFSSFDNKLIETDNWETIIFYNRLLIEQSYRQIYSYANDFDYVYDFLGIDRKD